MIGPHRGTAFCIEAWRRIWVLEGTVEALYGALWRVSVGVGGALLGTAARWGRVSRHGGALYRLMPHVPKLVYHRGARTYPVPPMPPIVRLPRTYRAPTSYLPCTYRAPTVHLPCTYRAPAVHLPCTCRVPTVLLPRTYRVPAKRLPRACPASTVHLPRIYLTLTVRRPPLYGRRRSRTARLIPTPR